MALDDGTALVMVYNNGVGGYYRDQWVRPGSVHTVMICGQATAYRYQAAGGRGERNGSLGSST